VLLSPHAKDLFCVDYETEQVLQKTKLFVLTQLSIPFQWQSKVVDPVGLSVSSFLYIFFIYNSELVLVLHIAEILLAGRYAIISQSMKNVTTELLLKILKNSLTIPKRIIRIRIWKKGRHYHGQKE
jgi:hypothetical protein